jgi:hypothetical protein
MKHEKFIPGNLHSALPLSQLLSFTVHKHLASNVRIISDIQATHKRMSSLAASHDSGTACKYFLPTSLHSSTRFPPLPALQKYCRKEIITAII